MKTLKKTMVALWPAIAMTVLILDPKTALQGAREGIDLCAQSVIPSLFPFIFLSGFITRTLLSEPIPLLRPVGQLCKIPYGCEGLLAVGLVGGYPVGAQCIAHAYGSGQLSETEGRRMLGFCSNAGPSFLFGILRPLFSDQSAVWILWVIQILSALFTGILLPGGRTADHSPRKTENGIHIDPLKQSMGAMAAICGWIILFRVVLSFLQRWFLWMLPTEAAVLLSGILELTNGCCQLSFVTSEAIRFLLAAPLLAFGGICVWLQTISVTQGLGTGAYLTGKLIQTGISTLLSCLILPLRYSEIPPFPFLLIPVTTGIILWITKKSFQSHSSFLMHQGV